MSMYIKFSFNGEWHELKDINAAINFIKSSYENGFVFDVVVNHEPNDGRVNHKPINGQVLA